jgi:NTP pyrophosphatase (non-canonical NTP hydrolase)
MVDMHSKDYIELAKKTESNDHQPIVARLSQGRTVRLLHAAMGASTEAGELLDAVKKHVFYGKPLDETNLFEEVGDIFWYLAILADELGFDFESAMQKNLAKLQSRYGAAFSSERAQVRDLAREREILS